MFTADAPPSKASPSRPTLLLRTTLKMAMVTSPKGRDGHWHIAEPDYYADEDEALEEEEIFHDARRPSGNRGDADISLMNRGAAADGTRIVL